MFSGPNITTGLPINASEAGVKRLEDVTLLTLKAGRAHQPWNVGDF